MSDSAIIEQVMLFGAAGDSQLALLICGTYSNILQALNKQLESHQNVSYNPVLTSRPATNHIKSQSDQEHLRLSHPCLDPTEYTKESFQARINQAPGRVYSPVSLIDGIGKIAVSLLCDIHTAGHYGDLVLHKLIPLLSTIYKIYSDKARPLVFGLLRQISRKSALLNKSDTSQMLCLKILIKAGVALIRLLGAQSLSEAEFIGQREFFRLIVEAFLANLVTRVEVQECWNLVLAKDKELSAVITDLDKCLLALEGLRTLSTPTQEGAHLSDLLAEFKEEHRKLKEASDALPLCNDPKLHMPYYVDNHLKSVLLMSQESQIDPEFNHHDSSVRLLNRIAMLGDHLLKPLLEEFAEKLHTPGTLGFPGMAAEIKHLALEAIAKPELGLTLIIGGLTSKNVTTVASACELLESCLDKLLTRNTDPMVLSRLIPSILSNSKTLSTSSKMLDSFNRYSKPLVLLQTFTSLFSKDKQVRCEAYSKLYQLEFFDQCLPFVQTGQFRPAPPLTSSRIDLPFSDPLTGIIGKDGSSLFASRLAVFKEKEGKLGRATQAQVKALLDLLEISLNPSLEWSVRGVALDQIAEALYFYRESPSLADFSKRLLEVSLASLEEFGSRRENFMLSMKAVQSLDESFMSAKSANELPIINKNFVEEKILVTKLLSALNSALFHSPALSEFREKELSRLLLNPTTKGVVRALWILVTSEENQTRYEALLLLNLISFSGEFILRNCNIQLPEKKLLEPSLTVPVLSSLKEKNYILFPNEEVDPFKEHQPFSKLDPKLKKLVQNFINQFDELARGPEGRHCNFTLKVNTTRLEELLVDSKVSRGLAKFSSLFVERPKLETVEFWKTVTIIESLLDNQMYLCMEDLIAKFSDLLKGYLIASDDSSFTKAAGYLEALLTSSTFSKNYSHSSPAQHFVHSLAFTIHEKLLPVIYELHGDYFSSRLPSVKSIITLLTCSIKLALQNSDQKYLTLAKGFISRNNFLEFLHDILKRLQASDGFSDCFVSFLRWHIDLFVETQGQNPFTSIIDALFSSPVLHHRTDNFNLSGKLKNFIILANTLVCKNQYLSLAEGKLRENRSLRKPEECKVTPALKTSTLAWVVSLLDHRSVWIRMSCWNIIGNYLDAELLELFPSLIENALSTLNLVNEATGVICLCYTFLLKVAQLIRKVEVIGTREQDRKIDRNYFVKLLHSRRAMDGIRRHLAHENTPNALLACCIRFVSEWYRHDPSSVENKYFHTDFLEKICFHLKLTDEAYTDCESFDKVRTFCDMANKALTSLHFLNQAVQGNGANSKPLMKNFGMVRCILGWIDFCSSIMHRQIEFESSVGSSNQTRMISKLLDKSAKELATNGIALLETLLKENPEVFIYYLNENEGSKKSKPIFAVFSDLLTNDSNDSQLGYSILKLSAKLLLDWDKGYSVIDNGIAGDLIAEHLISRTLCFFKNIDYTKMRESDYLEIINSEELLHILAVLVAKSTMMKEKFLSSGLYTLYVSKFLQIIQSFKKNNNLVAGATDKKLPHDKDQKNSRLLKPAMQAKPSSKRSTIVPAAKGQNPSSKIAKLHENIRLITENSYGHIRSYIQIAKYFFHCSRGQKVTSPKLNTSVIDNSIADLMSVINFLWAEGQFNDDLLSDLLELLINWHMNPSFSPSLFKRLIDQKYTLLPDILKTLAKYS